MTKPILTSPTNPLIKRARALRQHKARAESGLFLVEGIHPVGEAIEAGWEIDSVLYSPELLTASFAQALVRQLEPRVHAVTPSVMETLAEKENPQGILAVVRQRKTLLEDQPPASCSVALVSPQDPGNVGTILRTLDAVGADQLFLLDGGVDPYHPTAVRASMGALFWIPFVQSTFHDFLDWARQGKIQLVGTSAHAQTDYLDFNPEAKFCLVLGSEQKGLGAEQLAACDATLALPMRGRASSLNLAVAAGILLYQFARGRQA